jgi:hypothetical protein
MVRWCGERQRQARHERAQLAARWSRPRALVRATLLAASIALIAVPAAQAAVTTFTVNTALDTDSDGTCDADCTLRDAINNANANNNPEVDKVVFNGLAGQTLTLSATPPPAGMPQILEPLDIDGCAAPQNPDPSATQPCIGFNGLNTDMTCPGHTCNGGTAFNLGSGADGSTISGFALSNFGNTLIVGADGAAIKNNWVGFKIDGSAGPNGHEGIEVSGQDAVIGGPNGPGDRNVVGNIFSAAIAISRGDGTQVLGNYIGVGPDGTTPAPNGDGIRIVGQSAGTPDPATDNVIGGTPSAAQALSPQCDGPCNVIASSTMQTNGNFGDASPGHAIRLDIAGNSPAQQTTIQGNYIGTDVNATANRGSSGNGIHVGNAQDTVIGGSTAGEGNVIARSGGNGIDLADGDNTTIAGNFIGTNSVGTSLPTTGAGIRLANDSSNNTIGGDTAAAENVISHSGGDAIEISGSTSIADTIARNRGVANGDLFVDLGADGTGNPGSGLNGNVQAPAITSATTLAAAGTGAASAVVRVYSAPSATGEIEGFLGQTTADGSGNWTVTYPSPIPNGQLVTAGQTDGFNSSEMAATVSATDATPPDTLIDAGPSGATLNHTPSFEFHSTEANSTFECSLDNAGFATCSSPFTTPTLSLGNHTFEVRAIDPATNTDPTAASRAFSVNEPPPESIPPETTITNGPSGSTTEHAPTFEFTSNEAGSTFECSLDQATFALCSSPLVTASLADGAHTFQVRAIDPAANVDPTPDVRSFTIHTPDTVIDTGPSGSTLNHTPSFEFHSTEANSTFQCSLDNAAFATCSSPFTTPTLALGDHTFAVREIDPAANTDPTPATRAFSVTNPPPDSSPPETTITDGPSGSTTEHAPTFQFSSSEAGSTFECSLDQASFAPCSSPLVTASLADGAHTFQVRAIDPAGNVDPSADARSFTIGSGPTTDTVVPVVTAFAISPSSFASVLQAPSIAAAKGGTVRYTLSEAAAARFTVVRRLPGRRVRSRCLKPSAQRRGARCTRLVAVRGSFTHEGQAGANHFRFTGWLRSRPLSPGKYLMRGTATDAAGNRSAQVALTFRIVR